MTPQKAHLKSSIRPLQPEYAQPSPFRTTAIDSLKRNPQHQLAANIVVDSLFQAPNSHSALSHHSPIPSPHGPPDSSSINMHPSGINSHGGQISPAPSTIALYSLSNSPSSPSYPFTFFPPPSAAAKTKKVALPAALFLCVRSPSHDVVFSSPAAVRTNVSMATLQACPARAGAGPLTSAKSKPGYLVASWAAARDSMPLMNCWATWIRGTRTCFCRRSNWTWKNTGGVWDWVEVRGVPRMRRRRRRRRGVKG
ncbi:hypothetical protein QBC34DRAFT_458900 [Podospora aff. communis PSN243]|uniref:Uncharacterized protein n=1 Tax=Podospora aff. communis PSN243 TaxID=3040156 RepID=A0AAV9GRJ7_9PEZI|nr:hypothetical protein QBC34DRAFT_458900 [Podospora aff. communis PSN243]